MNDISAMSEHKPSAKHPTPKHETVKIMKRPLLSKRAEIVTNDQNAPTRAMSIDNGYFSDLITSPVSVSDGTVPNSGASSSAVARPVSCVPPLTHHVPMCIECSVNLASFPHWYCHDCLTSHRCIACGMHESVMHRENRRRVASNTNNQLPHYMCLSCATAMYHQQHMSMWANMPGV